MKGYTSMIDGHIDEAVNGKKEYVDKQELLRDLVRKIKADNERRMAVVDRDFIDLVNDATVIDDLVEVVRCRNCKWWEARSFGSYIGKCENPLNGLFNEYTDDEDFCSYGERKKPITVTAESAIAAIQEAAREFKASSDAFLGLQIGRTMDL